MIKHVIFDCFGTLIDTGAGSLDATGQILRNVGGKQDVREFYKKWKQIKKGMMLKGPFQTEKKLFELSLAQVFEFYGIHADSSKEVEPMIRTLFGDRRVFADVEAALNVLDETGVEYAIGSTTDTDSLMYFLELNHLKFDKIFTSEDMETYKPDPRFYKTILERTGWKAKDCLFVGDSLTDDVIGPKSVGMRAVLLDRKGEYQGTDKEVQPDFVISSLSELNSVIHGREFLLYQAALQGVFGKRMEYERSSITDALFVYLDGEPEAKTIEEVAKHFQGRPLVCLTKAWKEQIETQYPDAAIYHRYLMKPADQFVIPEDVEIPKDYRITLMDEVAFKKHPFSHGVNYFSWDDFERNGIGAVVLYKGEIVASASSFISLNGEVELDVSTKESHRGKKLAEACISYMLQDCMERGLIVHWDAQNDISLHLAQKFGFELETEYLVYWIEEEG